MKLALVIGAMIGFACVPVTYRAGMRRMAETRFQWCAEAMDQPACHAEVHRFCRDRGLEKTCGEGWVKP